MNYTKLLITGGFVCLVVLMAQVVFVTGANAATQCSGGSCWFTACNSNSDCGTDHFVSSTYSCQGNNFYQEYITYQCNNPSTQNASCSSTKSPKLLQICSQKCEVGLWYNGCSTSNGGSGTGSGTGGNLSCAQNAYKQCVSNISYWYDSCGSIQSVAQNCNSANQTCQNGQCVTTTPVPTYTAYASKTCYRNNIYWRDSYGYVTDLYSICNDSNSSTTDTCKSGQCVYTPTTTGTTGGTGTIATDSQTQVTQVAVSIFASKESSPSQLGKNLTVANGEKVYFLITVKNTSTQLVENVSVNADFAGNINYGNDLKIDESATGGDITAGIALGTIAPQTAKAITFSGTVQSLASQAFQVTSRVNANNATDSDFLTMTVGSTGTAAVSESDSGNAIWEFIKRWYIWIIILIVLAILFVIIFRRLSDSNA